VIGKWLLRRSVARVALTGLALGIAALAALALAASFMIEDTTAQVRTFNQVSARWEIIRQGINMEHAALNRYVAYHGSVYGQQRLLPTVDSVKEDIIWLKEHGGPTEAVPARMTEYSYDEYNRWVRSTVGAGMREESLSVYSELTSQSFARLSEVVSGNTGRRQRDLALFLERVDRRNATLRASAVVLVALDILLCLAGAYILIGYQRRAEAEARDQRYRALHDTLTGLANRQLLAERIDAALEEAVRTGKTVSLMLVDLDRFKAVNDTLGHQGGDALLKHVARSLRAAARAGDTVARIGGDEFAVLVPSAESMREIVDVAGRVHAALHEPLHVNGMPVGYGASVGVAVFPAHCSDAEGLMRHADIAMYAAKRGGLGVTVYEPEGSARRVVVLPRDTADATMGASPVVTLSAWEAEHGGD
jgi:diguanylate cyclase (GGDEF)-like protein